MSQMGPTQSGEHNESGVPQKAEVVGTRGQFRIKANKRH